MRKLYLALVLTLFVLPFFAQNIPSYVPKDGLVGYWPFNGNANDESGNGLNGTANGATFSTDRYGVAKSAYSFNGVDNSIEIQNTSTKEIGLNTFSYSFWIQRDRITKWNSEIIISKGVNNLVISNMGDYGKDTNQNYNGIGFDSYGKNFGTYNGILPINEWCHFVCVKTKNEFFYFIDNKKYSMPYNDFNIAKTDLNQVLVFGKRLSSGSGGIFSGLLDDVAIYNRSLSDQEVESLYKSLPTNEIPSYVPKNGLVAWYPFNGNANDESGNKHHGTVIGATPSVDRFGKENKAYYFDKDSIQANIENLVVNNSAVSVTGWFKSNVPIVNGWPDFTKNIEYKSFIFNYGNSSDKKSLYSFIINKGYLFISNNNYINLNYQNQYHLNQWHYLAVTYNGDTINTYINGILLKNGYGSNVGVKLNVLNTIFTIGKDFLGTLDDISVHNRVLTDTEINKLYNSDTVSCNIPTVSVFIEGKSAICEGQSTMLVATSNPDYKYQWYKNNNIVTGATTHTLITKESGNYFVNVTNGACEFKSDELTISVNTPPTAILIVQGKTAYCDGEKIATNLRVDGGTTFSWNTGETTSSIDVTTAGTSSVIVGNNSGCTVTLSKQIISSSLPKIAFEGPATYVFKNDPAIKLYTSPAGGTLIGHQIKDNMYYPANDNVGKHTISYSVTSLEGCTNTVSKSFYLVDTLMSNCTKILYDTSHVTTYDTLIVNKTKYDTITIKNNVYDTVKITKFDTITVTNNVTKYDTITVTNNITKYDTVIVKKNVFDTVKVNKYDTITVTNNVTKYDTVIVKTNVFDTVKVNKYDTITVTNNVTKYDTVIVNKTKYDTITVTDTVNILKIKFKLTTGLQANQMASMSVYPNPTSDVLHIAIGDAKALNGYRYRILDALGKEVYNELVKNSITEIPLKTLGAAGMYQLEVLDANNASIQTNKIMLQ